ELLRPLCRSGRFPAVRSVTLKEGLCLPKPHPRAFPGLFGLDLAVARRRVRLQRGQQPPRRVGDFRDRLIERRFIRLRRPVEAGELAHELQRGSMDLLPRRRRLEIEKRLDVAAHEPSPLPGTSEGRTAAAKSDNWRLFWHGSVVPCHAPAI